jgi:RNA recognition motif-containing protein
MKIYIGNMSFDTTEENLRQAFEGFGEVSSCNVIMDKFSGKPRGFAFVEMTNGDQANAAIGGLDGKDMDGRALKVSEARPRTDNNTGNRGDSYRQSRY